MELNKVIAVRTNKTVYRDGDLAIKVFSDDYSKADILNEALNHARAEETSLHVPTLREVTKVEGKWAIVSIEPTSSIRFERYGAAVVRKLGLRVLIGKTTMGRGTSDALREVGGVHLTKIGVCGNQLAPQVKSVRAVYFLQELGKTEATWLFEVESFGPFFVDMDARGNNYFEALDAEAGKRIEAVSRDMGIPAGYTYTHVDA